MNLFDQVVAQAMPSEQALGTVRPAVEKELLHQQMFQKEMERFLPASEIREAIHQKEFWTLLVLTLREHAALMASG